MLNHIKLQHEISCDRIEIVNPGGLATGLSETNFGRRSIRRNPLIASLLQRTRFMENMGTGSNKIRKLCQDQSIALPEFRYDEFFSITFTRDISSEGINEGLNNRQTLIKRAIANNPGINAKNFSEITKIPMSTLERDIKQLTEKNNCTKGKQ
jgi:ATP-dependent DNA helicase RecG